MKLILVVISVILTDVQSWSVNYREAKQIISPNFTPGRQNYNITCIVLHGTAGDGAVEWFQNKGSRVSAHYVIEKSGSIIQMVDEADTAWHTGAVSPKSIYYNRPNPDLWCIGIQFTRDLTNSNNMPEIQIIAGVNLVYDIRKRYQPLYIYTHDVFVIGRVCPGPNFPLIRFQNALIATTVKPSNVH